jgi:hypothetical protein
MAEIPEEKGWAWLAVFVSIEVAALGYLARKIRRSAAQVGATGAPSSQAVSPSPRPG